MLAAICIPEFPETALAWVQALRAKHDPKYFRLVPPHVTLVFPSTVMPEASLVAHVVACARGASGTTVEFPSAQTFPDESADVHLVYLVAGAGSDLFVQLHRKLYSGALAARQRPTVPYIPHVTVGRFTSSAEAAALAAEINAAHPPIAGRAAALDVVHVGEDFVRSIHSEALGAG